MGLFKKRTPTQPTAAQPDRPATPSDPALPGISGYQGVAGLKKNAMPERRFNYVRPDQRSQR